MVPALVSLWTLLLLGEVLPAAVWLGIALIVVGIVLSNWRALSSGGGSMALILSFCTGLRISVYSLVDGIGVRLSGNTISYWA